MPWVRFLADFEYRVKPTVIFVYRAGERRLVKAACAEQAIREGKATTDDGNGERSTP